MAENHITENIKPDFYDKFHCIADRCSFTCCQEWKIAVDDDTNAEWKNMLPPRGTKTRRKNLSLFTKFKDGGRVIALGQDHKCPFLDEKKLCRLVIQYGDRSISETCRIFPREIHDFTDRREYTLMPCCPEVIDLLNQEEMFRIQAGTDSSRLFRIRTFFMEMIQQPWEALKPAEIENKMLAIFFLADNFLKDDALEPEQAKEQLPEIYETIGSLRLDPLETCAECNELFLDLVENYRKEQMYGEYLEDMIADAEKTAERASAEAEEEEAEGPLTETAYEENRKAMQKVQGIIAPLMRKVLAQEFYADLITPDRDPENLAVRLEWIAMEYVQIRQLCMMKLKKEGKLEYTEIRDYIVLVSRMMGYEEDDIYEYMENSFEDIIWNFGYMALLLGNE